MGVVVDLKELRKINPAKALNFAKKQRRKRNKNNEKPDSKTILRDELDNYYSSYLKNINNDSQVEIEYIPEDIKNDVTDLEVLSVIESFHELEKSQYEQPIPEDEINDIDIDEENDGSDLSDDETMTKKQIRRMKRPTLCTLKQEAGKAEVVEYWDTTAPDPVFLVWIKGLKNSVPVPAHWKEKKRFMQGVKSFEKPPYKLPEYIEATKISEIRRSIQLKEANMTLKQKQREKVRAKLHRMDINYQVLHDAFFKYATKPFMTKYGDVYFEGKEMEINMRKFKPGTISTRLKQALSMVENSPPPWFANMQRYGLPPSYPGLRIPGLNAPILKDKENSGVGIRTRTDEEGNVIYNCIEEDAFGYLMQCKYWGDIDDEYLSDEEYIDPTEPTQEEDGAGETTLPDLAGNVIPSQAVVGDLDSAPNPIEYTEPLSAPVSQKPFIVLEQKPVETSNDLFASKMVYKMPPKSIDELSSDSQPIPSGVILSMNMPDIDTDQTMSYSAIQDQLVFHEQRVNQVLKAAGLEVQQKNPNEEVKKKKKFKF